MVSKLTLLALAASSSAQMTTSIWMLANSYGTDKIGWVGSVIDAKNGYTTLAIRPDNGTDTSALGLAGTPETVTVGPSYLEVTDERFGPARTTTGDENVYKVICTKSASGDANATCTASWGASRGRLQHCQTRRSGASTETRIMTETHTHPARGSYSAGVETFTRSWTFSPVTRTTAPAWCKETGGTEGAYSTTVPFATSNFAYYQLTVTAGAEKLNATTTSSETTSGSATPTSSSPSGSESGSSPAPAENSNAASPNRAGSMMAGVAFAAYFL